MFVFGVVSSYGGVSKYSFSEPSKPIGVEIAEEPIKPASTVVDQVQPPSQQTPVVVEEDNSANGNNIIKLLEETDLLDKIPLRKTKPITSGRGTPRRQRLPYRDPPPLVINWQFLISSC